MQAAKIKAQKFHIKIDWLSDNTFSPFPSVLRARPCRLSGQLINKGLLSRCIEQLPNPGLGFLLVPICNRDAAS